MQKLVDVLNILLVEKGFTKSGSRWYKRIDTLPLKPIMLLELQKSVHANGSFINVGVYYNAIEHRPPSKLQSYNWHWNTRYQLLGDWEAAESLAPEYMEDENTQLLVIKIETTVIPFLESLCDSQHLKNGFVEKYDVSKVWLQNITSKALLSFIETNT